MSEQIGTDVSRELESDLIRAANVRYAEILRMPDDRMQAETLLAFAVDTTTPLGVRELIVTALAPRVRRHMPLESWKPVAQEVVRLLRDSGHQDQIDFAETLAFGYRLDEETDDSLVPMQEIPEAQV